MLRSYLVALAALLALAAPARAGDVRVEFEVEAPRGTTAASVIVVGDHPALGAWNPQAGLVCAWAGGVYRGSVSLPSGGRVAYKVVLSHWETVEKAADGGELSNRTLKVKAGRARVRVARFHDGRPQGSSAGERVRLLGNYGDALLGVDRPVWVHLPKGFDPARSYRLLFMLDGQNLFDRRRAAFGNEWCVDETHDRLVETGKMEPLIICGIGNSPRRMAEYTPDRDPKYSQGGALQSLHRLIQDELKPALAARYKLRAGGARTGVVGSSLGGLAAFHLSLAHPGLYDRAGAVSPSLWWNGCSTLAALRGRAKVTPITTLWLDIGSGEGDGVTPVKNLAEVVSELRKKGYDRASSKVYVDPGATHSESAWRKRLPLIFETLYPASGGP